VHYAVVYICAYPSDLAVVPIHCGAEVVARQPVLSPLFMHYAVSKFMALPKRNCGSTAGPAAGCACCRQATPAKLLLPPYCGEHLSIYTVFTVKVQCATQAIQRLIAGAAAAVARRPTTLSWVSPHAALGSTVLSIFANRVDAFV
jgi:hypothetical protein